MIMKKGFIKTQDVFTKNLGYSMQNVCNKNVAYCKIIFSVIL